MDISVSNSKDIIYPFIILSNKYVWGSLALMVQTDAGSKNIFRQVEQIHIVDIHHQAHVYFGLTIIGNVVNDLPNPLVLSVILNLDTTSQEVQNLYDRVRSDMISKIIGGSITNTYIKKLRLH